MTNAKTKLDLYNTAHAAAVSSLGLAGVNLDRAVHKSFTDAGHDDIDYEPWRLEFDNARDRMSRLSREKSPSQFQADLAAAATKPAGETATETGKAE